MNDIKLLTQPTMSNTCAHHVVAMLTNTPIDDIYTLFGHKHSSSGKDMRTALDKLGYNTPNRFIKYSDKMFCAMPDIAILRFTWYNDIGKSIGRHVALLHYGYIYDSCSGKTYFPDYPTKYKQHCYGRLTSLLPITPPQN